MPSLIHAGFLAAALAVAIPVLIHLLFRQRARRVEIGSLRFLKIVLQDRAHRRKLRRWILLAMRVAGVLLLALLFARPYLQRPGALGKDQEVAILIDRSASMGAGGMGPTAFASAQQAARKLIQDLPEGTVVHLAHFDSAGVAPAASPVIDDSLEPGFAAADYSQALAWARDLFSRSTRPVRKLYVLTDLQRSGLTGAAVTGFPPEVAVELVDSGGRFARNLAIEGTTLPSGELRPGQPLTILVHVTNHGPIPVNDVDVTVSLSGPGDKIERTEQTSLAGGGRGTVRFSLPLTAPGVYEGTASLDGDDPLPFDDRRFVAFEVRTPEQVLLVDGDYGETPYSQETYYLETALRLSLPGEGPAVTPYEPKRIAWTRSLALPDLSQVKVIVLANVPSLDDAAIGRLRDFVMAGGRLLVFGGDKVSREAYRPLTEAGLIPGTIREAPDAGLFRFDAWDKTHPILRPLSDPQQGDLRSVRFLNVMAIRPASGAKILAQDQDDRPLIVEGGLGQGTTLFFAGAADREWGDFPTNRLYLPLVHQMLGYLSGRLEENQRVVAEPAGPARDNPPSIERRGETRVVRNIDTRESPIDRLSVAEFRQELGLPNARSAAAVETDDRLKPPSDSQRPDELWRYVLWALLAILVGETFIANRTHA